MSNSPPHQIERYPNQVGGHCAILKPSGTSYLYKPLAPTELAFYERISNRLNGVDEDSAPLSTLRHFVPQFYGTGTVSVSGSGPIASPATPKNTAKYLILEDLLSGHRKPCIVDIKLGRLQRTQGASPEKQRRQWEKALKTTSHALGFRLCGMQNYNAKSDALVYRDKYWGRKLKQERIGAALKAWFSNGITCYYDLINVVYTKILMLIEVIRELKHYRFWSCSLLCVYDGATMDPEKRRQTLDIRLIDFANVTTLPENPTPDGDMLLGLENLTNILYKLVAGNTSALVKSSRGLTGRRFDNRVGRNSQRRRRRLVHNSAFHTDTDESSFMSEEDDVLPLGGALRDAFRMREIGCWFDIGGVLSSSVPVVLASDSRNQPTWTRASLAILQAEAHEDTASNQ
eukprot:Protomagalhaensia_sp_Gyna_25__5344@NODE_678_length_2852_cov_558_856737_g529_i0_p1_GENE_NODE_678_length_2852_cov_558_856737_g529_i0NODE_678_length_2852_cov_558_856737_g529_i0_p1_ORF_typecomplete_len401_score56_20IPK/PF03770_16/2e51_NODE_678_length_2852_cov_558_856737_g529_i03921594